MSRSVGSRRLFEESPSSGHLTKRISTRSRGKFDKYVKMPYRSQKVDIPSPSKWDAGPVQTDTMVTMSRWPSNEFKHTCKDLSFQKVKVTWKSELTGHGTEEINSVTEKQESKPFAELKTFSDIDTYMEYKNPNLCKKELQDAPLINLSGGSSIGSDLLNIKPKTEINLPFCLVLDATWCGSLEILHKDSGIRFYDGFVAHLPGKVCRKALEHTNLMPNVLPCTMLACCNVWEEIFSNKSPTIEDIALFFFPGNFERSKEQYCSLVQVMETQDLILRSLIKGISLLIFSSKRLHLNPCGLKMKSFLWGLYCPLQLTNDSQAHSMKVKLPLLAAGDAALLTT